MDVKIACSVQCIIRADLYIWRTPMTIEEQTAVTACSRLPSEIGGTMLVDWDRQEWNHTKVLNMN